MVRAGFAPDVEKRHRARHELTALEVKDRRPDLENSALRTEKVRGLPGPAGEIADT